MVSCGRRVRRRHGSGFALRLDVALAGKCFCRACGAGSTESPSPTPAQPAASGVLVWTPPPVGSKSALKAASKVEVDEVVTHRMPPTAAKEAEPLPDKQPLQQAAKAPDSVEPPQMASLAPDKSLAGLVAPAVSIPAFNTRVSQGVVEGTLQHKVQPVYPTDAMPLRLSGAVVLEASVAEDGKVQNLKVVSGHPILARAAVGAVRQWRYSPSTLNGKPVQVQKEITVSFKAP